MNVKNTFLSCFQFFFLIFYLLRYNTKAHLPSSFYITWKKKLSKRCFVNENFNGKINQNLQDVYVVCKVYVYVQESFGKYNHYTKYILFPLWWKKLFESTKILFCRHLIFATYYDAISACHIFFMLWYFSIISVIRDKIDLRLNNVRFLVDLNIFPQLET